MALNLQLADSYYFFNLFSWRLCASFETSNFHQHDELMSTTTPRRQKFLEASIEVALKLASCVDKAVTLDR